MYWTDVGGFFHSLSRANLDGSGVQEIVPFAGGDNTPAALALDVPGAKVYWVNHGGNINTNNQIRRADLDGNNVQILHTPPQEANDIELDLVHGKMYWTQLYGEIHRANLDGTGHETLVTGAGAPMYLALDVPGGRMYWTEFVSRRIFRSDLNGGSPTPLWSGNDPRGIALDLVAGKMYWTDAGTLSISRANLDGSSVEVLISSGLQFPLGIALDPQQGHMYWVDGGTHRVQRAGLNGSNVVTLVGDIGLPTDIELALSGVTEPQRSSWGRIKSGYR
jgi:low density lipoprotein receptor-related protein 5/6